MLVLEVADPGVIENANQLDSLVRLLHDELVNKVLVLLRELRLEGNLLADLVAGDGDLIASEWRVSMHELIEQNTKRPNVEHMIVLTMVDHLRGHVL